MGKKKKILDYIYFAGESSNEVTGSMYYVQFGEHRILIECGLYQSSKNSALDAYKVNTRKFDFDPKTLDYVFVCHAHIDHTGLLPRLYKEGFRGKVIMTEKTKMITRSLLLNSCHILYEEARKLSVQFNRDYKPIYDEADVYNIMFHTKSYDEYDVIYELEDGVEFQWLKNSHCVGAAQLQLILSDSNRTKKILYTSDIGSLQSENHFVENTYVPDFFNDVVIMESTYGDPKRSKRKTRNFDMKKMKTAIETTLNRDGKFIMPCFSFFRTQELLITLYSLFADDDDFKADVVVDSVLSVDMCKLYSKMLTGEDLELWNDIMNWKQLKLISRKDKSLENVQNPSKQIILSSSGFCTNGRIIGYLQEYLKDVNSTICFSGYTGDNHSYLAYRIQHAEDQKTITLNHKRVKNKADSITLSSYSSHANHQDLVKYAGQVRTNTLVLVHGDPDAKQALKKEILKECSKQDKTTKVVVSERKMLFPL